MHKGLGRKQQIRGHKRRLKVLNRLLNRNASDQTKNAGAYANSVVEELNRQIENEKTVAEERVKDE
jgi:hypothetical protein